MENLKKYVIMFFKFVALVIAAVALIAGALTLIYITVSYTLSFFPESMIPLVGLILLLYLVSRLDEETLIAWSSFLSWIAVIIIIFITFIIAMPDYEMSYEQFELLVIFLTVVFEIVNIYIFILAFIWAFKADLLVLIGLGGALLMLILLIRRIWKKR